MTTSILIVEDESIVALDLEARLSGLGYQVVGIADSSQAALELAETRHPDLTLMDIRLNGAMDGVETAQQLRDRFDIPVIYLTAYADEATLQRAKVTEPFGYLLKPFEERELYSTVEMALYKIANERRFKAHAARLEKIISGLSEGVALLNADGRVELANANACDYLNLLTGVGVGSLVERLGEQPLEEWLSDSADQTRREIRLSGSRQQIFEVTMSPVRLASGASTSTAGEWVLVMRDVTEEREIQQRVQTQDRLAAVGQFAAGMAHDFRNLLTGIVLGAQILKMTEGSLSEASGDRLDNIQKQALRASELIKQVLDFSRASEMLMQPFDLIPVLKELAKMLERLLPESIRLELGYLPGEYRIMGDITRIIQMLMNLALNARDAMSDGGRLRIKLTHVSSTDEAREFLAKHEAWIRCTVSDTGTGIAPDVLPRVFEPFFTTKARDKGTGLGLAQVHGIVQQHGGHIEVESQLGQGTSFSIYLPALSSPASVKDYADSGKPPRAQGNQQAVLLVEDNLVTRNAVREVLELSDYRVLSASNGLEALTIIEQSGNQVDLVLSDLDMPMMGGLELCRELRRNNNHVRIIIFTGYAADETLQELRALAVAEILDKPVEVGQLLRTLENAR